MPSLARKRQTEIYLAGFARQRPAVPVAPDALERKALARLSARAGGYLAGGAGAESTMTANRAAFGRYGIVQRVLRNVEQRDLSVEVLGRRWPLPFGLAPIGVLELAHRQGDLAAARAAARHGIPFVASSQASYPIEDIAEAGGDGPRWFQLYWSSRDELARSFVERAEKAGYEAIVITLDTPELGWRPRDLDNGYLPFMVGRGIANYVSDPVFNAMNVPSDQNRLPNPPVRPGLLASLWEMLRAWPEGPVGAIRRGPDTIASARKFIATYSRLNLSWDDLGRIRDWTRLPVLLKGIVHPDDARHALSIGVDGIIVSNHGGRQVDGARAALDALPGIVQAVDGRIPVIFDSGIRTGADVLKAIALGARAVLLGRPYAYGLALGAEEGASAVIGNLAADTDANLGLSGNARLADIGPETLGLPPFDS